MFKYLMLHNIYTLFIKANIIDFVVKILLDHLKLKAAWKLWQKIVCI